MSKDDNTWLNVAYVSFALLIAYVVYRGIEMAGIQTGWIERFEWFSIATTVTSVVAGAGASLWLRSDRERNDYFLAAIAELRKVTWPTWIDTKRMTIVVCVFVAIFAVILGVFDLLWAKALNVLLT
jgi:preprotein translocase subunit SecE